ncbi:MAG: archaellin/type IV pilin N-terminal domain-containing protein [Zestosphaera sp.]
MKLNKAISPILATVILIAVTLIIAIAVIGWIMGVWGSLGAPSESLSVVSGQIKCANGVFSQLELTIINKGNADSKISKVEVVGFTTTTAAGTVGKGSSTTITAGLSGSGCMLGASYDVKVYTEAGNVYPGRVSATTTSTT